MKTVFLESHHLKNKFFGFGQFNYHIIKALSKQEHSDFEIILHTKHLEKLKKEFGSTFKYKKYYSLRRYKEFRIRRKYDLWHSLNQNTRIEPFHDIPYLLTVHNITHIKDPENYKELEVHKKFQKKLDRSSAITYISEYAKTSTHQFFQVPRVPEQVIYNGNPITEIKISDGFEPRIKSERPYLFSIGEFTERKNFKTLVAMLQYTQSYNLILAGKNSTKYASEIRALISEMKLENRIFLPGKISEEEKQYYYQHCEAFVFPSLREGFGLPVIEAMRFGKPVFISNNTSLPEIGGNLAFFWNHYDPKYMAETLFDGIRRFLNDENNYKKKSVLWAEQFSWNRAAQQYVEIYRSLL